MLVTFNKADVVKNENGTFLHLELQVLIPGKNIVTQSVFPATTNYDPDILERSQSDFEVIRAKDSLEE